MRDIVQCRDLKGCVKISKVCDGNMDCSDGSDEVNCDALCESIGYWPCRSTLPPFAKCISRQERCDGYVDCRDFSDEIGCGNVYQWKCPGENTCLPESFLCDTIQHCANGEDEKNCEEVSCLGTACESTFKCGAVMLDMDTCDGVPDCLDVTEEKNCGRITMFSNRLPCIRSNRFISRDNICDGIPDCVDASDEDVCAGKRF
uniref:Uncharacterized protein n=1 Tax=Branchiostoma floridae TaxID=7739 RepID=C3ZNN6_BRAFL|eukprot:XP_002589877.1 hypothetical protein BRAFLDRAFT_235851 [Branchiostoma floridae]